MAYWSASSLARRRDSSARHMRFSSPTLTQSAKYSIGGFPRKRMAIGPRSFHRALLDDQRGTNQQERLPVPKGLHFIYPLLNRGVTAAVGSAGDNARISGPKHP